MNSLVRRGLLAGRILPRLLRSNVGRSRIAISPAVTDGRLFSQKVVPLETEEGHTSVNTMSRVEEILDKKLYKLDMDVRRLGRASTNELDELVNFVERTGGCTANQALLILRCCGSVLVDLSKEERCQRLERVEKVLQKAGVEYDVSHYNALLKVHMENESSVTASEFLSLMEEAGVQPNRVTFQHLVGIYCQTGNIGGATTVLEHMKSEEMAINEAVFLSLLYGHCVNNDSNSVTTTMEVMANSGLLVGVETFTTMAVGYAKAGNGAKVEEVLQQAKAEDVKMGDGDVFRIIVACCQSGLQDNATSLLESLPKKAGFFQEMRNVLPEIIRSGAFDVATDIFLDFPLREDDNYSDKGRFLIQHLCKSGVSPEKALEIVMRMSIKGYTNAASHIVISAAQMKDIMFCEEFGALLAGVGPENLKSVAVDDNTIFGFLRTTISTLRKKDDLDTIFPIMNNMRRMRVRVHNAIIGQDLLPAMLDFDKEPPAKTLIRFNTMYEFNHWTESCNLLVMGMLNKENSRHFLEAAGILLNVKIGHAIPERWSASLARSYLATGDLESFISFLFYGSRMSNMGKRSVEEGHIAVFTSLINLKKVIDRVKPNSSVEEVLTPVIAGLVEHKIGVTKGVGKQLASDVQNPSFTKLVDEAIQLWENKEDIWSPEKEDEFLQQRKQQLINQRKEAGFINIDSSPVPRNFGRYSKVPESLPAMEAAFQMVKRQDISNFQLFNNLIMAYAANDQIDDANKVLVFAKEKGFAPGLTVTDAITKSHLRRGEIDEAFKLIDRLQSEDESVKIYGSTFIDMLTFLAEKGEHQKILDIVPSCPSNNFINMSQSRVERLLEVYSQQGLVEQVSSLFHTLRNGGWISSSPEAKVLAPLIEAYLVTGDSVGATQEFEKIVRHYKKMAKKFDLTNRLIEEENVDAMQKVLDISIELIGEERSLYDLAFCFLQMDRKAQVKKLFETPGLRYNEEKMAYLCSSFRRFGKLQQLEDLVQFSKAIFGCDRDFLYQQLVAAYSDDAERVQECWIQIQEEGHAPSDELKISIAKSLKAGGKSVPFEVPIEFQEVTGKSSEKVISTKEVKISEKKEKADSEPKIHKENIALTALKNKDYPTLHEELKKHSANISGNCKSEILKTLMEENNYEEALKVVNIIVSLYKKPKVMGSVLKDRIGNFLDELIKKDKKQYDDLETNWGFEQKRAFSLSSRKNKFLLENDDAAYIECLHKYNDGKNIYEWIINPKVLSEISTKKPELISRIENLASEGNISANALMCKLSLEQEDLERFVNFWDKCGDSIEERVSIIQFRSVDTSKKYDIVATKISADHDLLKELTNRCLFRLNRVNKDDELLDVSSKALNMSIPLESFEISTLRKLLSIPEFTKKDEAQKIIDAK